MKRYYAVLITVYTLFLLYMMFFGCGRHATEGFIQKCPFQSIKHFLYNNNITTQSFMVNIVGNILVFIPFGWLEIWNKKFRNYLFLLVVFASGICIIELSQYYTKRGTADIDDLFLNTFGMTLGYAMLRLAHWLNIANIKMKLELEYD